MEKAYLLSSHEKQHHIIVEMYLYLYIPSICQLGKFSSVVSMSEFGGTIHVAFASCLKKQWITEIVDAYKCREKCRIDH